jgi:hypothetical protein
MGGAFEQPTPFDFVQLSRGKLAFLRDDGESSHTPESSTEKQGRELSRVVGDEYGPTFDGFERARPYVGTVLVVFGAR